MHLLSICLLAVLLSQTTNQEGDRSRLYDYDPQTPPPAYQEKLVRETNGVKIFDASFASPKEGRVPMYVVVPPGKGPFAGVIFQHGGGQGPHTYLAEAVLLAQAGAVCLLTDAAPRNLDPARPEGYRDDYIRMVVEMRRAMDLLGARGDVDTKRIGYVGHSYGATPGPPWWR